MMMVFAADFIQGSILSLPPRTLRGGFLAGKLNLYRKGRRERRGSDAVCWSHVPHASPFLSNELISANQFISGKVFVFFRFFSAFWVFCVTVRQILLDSRKIYPSH